MKPLLFHSYTADIAGRSHQILSVFVACHELTANEFDAAIAGAIASAHSIDSMNIVGYEEDVEKIRGWLTADNNVSLERMRTVIGNDDSALCFISFQTTTGSHIATTFDGAENINSSIIETSRRLTLLTTFKEAGGVQKAPAGTHFAKTSTSHSDRFLRVSNVLEEGANVRLVAYWLIPYFWKNAITSVIVDTSGIYSIALTAIHEASIRGGLEGNPLVWSHRSHEGVDTVESHRAEKALCLISASTSGGLAQRLLTRGAKQEQIVTLFSLSPSSPAGHILCDLVNNSGVGIDPIVNHQANTCELCKKHFHLIRIQGDQFSIAPPSVTLIEIKTDDLPPQNRLEVGAILGLRAFVAYRRHASGRIANLALNVAPILNAPLTEKNRALLTLKRERWVEFVRRSSTVSTRHVVASSYPGSKEIADDVAKGIRAHLQGGSGLPSTVTPESLRAASPQTGTSTIVVSACIDEVKELLSVSRTLRDVQEGGSTSYLAVADMLGPKAEHDRLRSNLTFGKHGAGTFNLHTLFTFPIECYDGFSSWGAEINELIRVIDWADGKEKDIPPEIHARIRHLQAATSQGLIDDLFWPSMDGSPLGLRSDFTLIADARRDPAASQADLFAVMTFVLSSLRNSTNVNRRLAHNAYERAVLTPSNFDRFNDGVLQGCILRAARPNELAYGACDQEVSEQMQGVLLHALPSNDLPEKAEAIMEFLIALLTRQLTLHKEHLLDFCQRVLDTDVQGTVVVKVIAEYLLDRENNTLPMAQRSD